MNSNEVYFRDLNDSQKLLILQLILRDGLQNFVDANILVSLDDNNSVMKYTVICDAKPEELGAQDKHLKYQPLIIRDEEDTWLEWNPREFQKFLFDHNQGYQLSRHKKLLLQKFEQNKCSVEIINGTTICHMDVTYFIDNLYFVGTLSGYFKDNRITFKITWIKQTGLYIDDKSSISRNFISN